MRFRHIQSPSPVLDVCYQLAYDVVRAAAQAAMTAGLQADGRHHHQTIFEFLRLVDGGRWAEEAEFFDQARGKRRLCVYEQNGAISVTEAEELLSVVERLLDEVEGWLAERDAPRDAAQEDAQDG